MKEQQRPTKFTPQLFKRFQEDCVFRPMAPDYKHFIPYPQTSHQIEKEKLVEKLYREAVKVTTDYFAQLVYLMDLHKDEEPHNTWHQI